MQKTKSILFTLILLLVSQLSFASGASDSGSGSEPVLNIKHWQTDNGAKTYFVANHDVPMVNIMVVFNAGSAYDGKQPGLANFVNGMLNEGSVSMSANETAENFDKVGAIYGNSISRDAAIYSLTSLSDLKQMQPALETFTKVLNTPTFPKKSFARVRQQILRGLDYQQQSPQSLASKSFYQNLYHDYPYGHDPQGNKSSINKITAKQIRDFYHQYYVGTNATIAIVGDVSVEQAKDISNQVIAALPKGKLASSLGPINFKPMAQTKHIQYPSTQTFVRIGTLGIKRDDPNYFPLIVGNHVLGGGLLVSRLFTKVREEKGYSYSVGSRFVPMLNQGPFLVGLQTRNKTTNKAIELSKKIIKTYITDGPTDAELASAKKYLTGSFPLKIDNNSDIAANIAWLGFYGLPLNYFDTYKDNVNQVSNKDIQEAFRKTIDPDKLLTITVGPSE